MQRDLKEFLAASAVVASLVVAGANLIATGHADIGWLMLTMALALLAAALAWFFWWPFHVGRVTTRIVEWLTEVADYGTTQLFNAHVRTPDEAERLRERHQEWHDCLIEGVTWYCLPSDASRVRMHDLVEMERIKDSGPGWGDGHVKRLAIDMVKRTRDLARRLDQRQTRLRRIGRLKTSKLLPP